MATSDRAPTLVESAQVCPSWPTVVRLCSDLCSVPTALDSLMKYVIAAVPASARRAAFMLPTCCQTMPAAPKRMHTHIYDPIMLWSAGLQSACLRGSPLAATHVLPLDRVSSGPGPSLCTTVITRTSEALQLGRRYAASPLLLLGKGYCCPASSQDVSAGAIVVVMRPLLLFLTVSLQAAVTL